MKTAGRRTARSNLLFLHAPTSIAIHCHAMLGIRYSLTRAAHRLRNSHGGEQSAKRIPRSEVSGQDGKASRRYHADPISRDAVTVSIKRPSR